jgi:hypothetical protein
MLDDDNNPINDYIDDINQMIQNEIGLQLWRGMERDAMIDYE